MTGTVLEAADYHGSYPGNFVPSLLAVGQATRERLGLGYHVVLPAAVEGRPWVGLLAEHGFGATFLAQTAGRRERQRTLEALGRRLDVRLMRSHFTAFDLETAVAARRVGARAIWNIHADVPRRSARQRASDLVKVRLIGRRLCHRVIAVSEEIGRQSRARGFAPGQVTVVLNGIALSRFAALPERAEARARLGLAPDDRVLLAFGWDSWRKGVDLIAGALAGLDAVALVVGEEALERFLRHEVAEVPPSLRVVAPRDDPGELFAAADVFVSASRAEAFSYAIGEAMAAGLPVVSSDIAGPSAFFAADGVRTFPDQDVGALRGALEDVLQADRVALGAANRRYVADRLGLDRHVDGVLEVFEAELTSRG